MFKLLGFVILICFQAVATAGDWKSHTMLGLHVGQTFNQAFLGLQNGVGFSPGVQLDEGIRFYKLPHEWRSEFSLSEAWTLTTPQTVFIKSSDSLSLKSSYLCHVWDQFGPYVSAKLRMSLFPGFQVEAISTTYTITNAATGVQTIEKNTGSENTGTLIFPLTQAFLPLFLEQDLGVFAQPYHEDELFLEFRAGATARENIAKDQRILTSIGIVYGNTPVRQLNNIYELGPSVGMHFKGEFLEKKVSYRLSCDALWSLVQVPIASVVSPKQLSFDLSTGIGVNLLSWFALHWQLKAIFNPAILDQLQLMSHLMLAVHFKN